MKLPEQSFDAITMIDVLEHLTDPLAAMRRAAELLRPEGILYLVTPDISSFSARLLRGSWWGLRPAHLYYFSPATLKRMLDEAGFEIRLLKSYGRMFTYQYWVSRLRNYPRPLHAGVSRMVSFLRLERKLLYLDTRDSMEVCAVRRAR